MHGQPDGRSRHADHDSHRVKPASGPTAIGPAESTATATSAPAATPAATTAPPAATLSATDSTPATAKLTCARQAAATYLLLTHVQAAPDAVLTLTAQPTRMVCGGPDDFHFQPTGTTVTARTTATASIEVFSIPLMRSEPIQPAKLAGYLASDGGTRIFEVTGPLTAITSLQERYHP